MPVKPVRRSLAFTSSLKAFGVLIAGGISSFGGRRIIRSDTKKAAKLAIFIRLGLLNYTQIG